VAEEIAQAGGRAAVEVLDLLSLASVRAFARRWGERPVHILINNAGLMGPPYELSEDGFESQMAVNFFGPFLLTRLLAPNLAAAAPARVVILSSGSHHMSDVDLDDPHYRRRPYEKFAAYGQSKTAANLLAVAFNRRFASQGVTANAVTPGAVVTNLGRHVTQQDAIDLGWLRPDGTVPDMIFKTPEQGAATSVWAAVAPELEGVGGLYLEDCQVAPFWSAAKPLKGVKAYSLDHERADRLWRWAEDLVDQPRSAA
jgi:NAD(P)-dependent dehydrogenase (short-subunit alcohol dehydrogenase family)